MKAMTRAEAQRRVLDPTHAVAILEGIVKATCPRDTLACFQVMSDNPRFWKMEGRSIGRAVYELRKDGLLEV